MSVEGSQDGRVSGLLPWPRQIDFGSSSLAVTGRFQPVFEVCSSPRLETAVGRLNDDLERFLDPVSASSAADRREGVAGQDEPGAELKIRCLHLGAATPGLEDDESYWLAVDDTGIYLEAPAEWGVLRGLATLGQLIREDGTLPFVAVDDAPRFSWRGLLLDPARHFLPLDTLLEVLDGMARCKLNVLHLHLTDDQGFRFPVPTLPKLASATAYETSELETLVAAAAELGIRVVPEIDMPGHVTSWLTAYPEWGSRQVAPTERFGVHGACLDPSNEAVFTAIGAILDAVVAVFPDPCLHIGGDEVSPRWWDEDPAVAVLMEREGLEDVRAVQGYFNQRVGAMVAERGRTVLAWDEVLDAGFGTDWVVQAWRGSTMRDRITAAGNRALVSAPYYLDLHYPLDVHYGFDPAAPQPELLALEDELLSDPRFRHVSDGMRWTEQWREGMRDETHAASELLLGAEACLWSELVTASNLTTRLWTRLPALAERFWSAAECRALADVHERVDAFLARSARIGSVDPLGASAAALQRLGVAGEFLEALAWFEPVKWYGRLLGAQALAARIAGREMPQARPYTLTSSLDEVIDHLPVESRAARRLEQLCLKAANVSVPPAELSATLEDLRRLAALGERELPDALPGELVELLPHLGRLADAVEARLGGERLAVETLAELLTPAGELILAGPKSLCLWLTQP